uniref:peptidyl-tRNA hydrolase n=1 Tax=Pristionchus pacificus TaxID=54126 RepID=A0A8R1UJH4_PRIPA
MSGRDAKFIKTALPFFSLVLGGAWGLHYFQQVRYDFRHIQQLDNNTDALKSDLNKGGIKVRDNVTVETVYKEVAQLDTDNWENIRGPRDTEDLTQYNKIKNSQQEANTRARAEKKLNDIPDPNNLPGFVPPVQDAGDNPPEPNTSNTSTRAVRGSPSPSLSQVTDPIPDPFSPPSVLPFRRIDQSDRVPLPDIPVAAEINPTAQAIAPSNNLSHPVDPANQVDPQLLSSLHELGFEEEIAKIALVRTANTSVEAAVQWIVERSNESDFEDEDEEETEEEMGGSNSIPMVATGRTHKMVLVANMSLKMGTGKLAAQVGHATLAVYKAAMSTEEGKVGIEAWQRHGQVKIVVKGESTEQLMDLFKTAKDVGVCAYIVQDAGYTQIPPGSRTVLGLFGPVQAVDAVTGHLKLL